MSRISFFLAFVSLLFSFSCGQQIPGSLNLTFTLQTAAAPWQARFAGTVEQLPMAITYMGNNFPAGSFVLHGGQSASGSMNDVWISTDRGVGWTRINTGAAGQSYTPTWMGGYTKDYQGRLYRTGGARADGSFSNEVWMSANGGVSWTRQNPTLPSNIFDGRTFPEMMANAAGHVFVATGLTGNTGSGPGLNDVWRSIDGGRNWVKQANLPFPAPPGRSSASLLQHNAPALAGKSVLWYMGGYSRYENGVHDYHNDIYISTDNAASWRQITANAPWEKRDNFNAEVTDAGVIVLSAGYNENGAVGRNNLNDVWASLDGGWTWGQCTEDAPFTDRRWQMTMLDNEGYFYIIGGDEGANNASTQRIPKNDVWRSQFSFNDIASMSRLCKLTVPICGVGLFCLPGTETRIENGQVTCPATQACSTNRMAFKVMTAEAAWSVRHTAGLEMLKSSMRINGVTYPENSMVLWGGVGNDGTSNDALLTDTWISSDRIKWTQISTGGFAGSAFSGHAADSRNRLYKVGGERWGGSDPAYVHGEVFMSVNGGQSWTKQTSSRPLPKRAFADVYADSKDNLFAIGGLDGPGGSGLNDVWRSINQGKEWTLQGRIPFSQKGGRSSASLLISYSKILQKDILTYIGGFSRYQENGNWVGQYHKDIWVSSNEGRQWTPLTTSAPWAERDNFNAEVTEDGILVIAGGYNNREALNDVWISADGGYSWGQCNSQAQFSDRRWQMTVLDQRGYLYIVGGEEFEGGRFVKQNDVWQSTVSLTARKETLRRACPGVQFSSCTNGLSCWPKQGSSSPWRENRAATCPQEQECNLPEGTANGGGGGEIPDNGGEDDGTTGAADSSSGLSTGAIVLIAILVIAGLGGIFGYFYYKRQQSSPTATSGTEGLLGTSEVSDKSTM